MFQVLTALAVAVMATAFLYLGWGMGSGWRQLRRKGVRVGHQASLGYGHPHEPAPPAGWFVYFLVPALNEAEVIGRTVSCLIGSQKAHVVVIDDGSDDGTGALASAAGRGEITVIRRELPEARQGKGAALNAGYAFVSTDVWRRGLDPESVIVCVMDADGRLSDGALSEVLGCFDDPVVGAVQLSVRIRNRDTFLTAYQDYLFWSMAAMSQFGRMATGTVSLGGNGQFSRLTALRGLGPEPWSESLTEDLDLGIRLALDGWVSTSAPGAAVDQQAVATLDRLVRQRRRWYQGHMAAGKHIPAIRRCGRLPHARALELVAYLSVPWVLDLPWSILFHVCVIGVLAHLTLTFGLGNTWAVPFAIAGFYVAVFFPCICCGLFYWRRDRRVGLDRALLFGHAIVAMNYVSFYCAWTALFRLVRGQNSWVKTSREREPGGGAHTGFVAPEPAVAVLAVSPTALHLHPADGATGAALARAVLLCQARLRADGLEVELPAGAPDAAAAVEAAARLHRSAPPRLHPLH